MVDSVVGHWCGVNCMVDRGVGNGAACKGCEGNLGISLGLGGSQDSGEEGSNGECLKINILIFNLFVVATVFKSINFQSIIHICRCITLSWQHIYNSYLHDVALLEDRDRMIPSAAGSNVK